MAFFDDPALHDFPDRAIRQMQAHAAHLRELMVAVVPAVAERMVFEQVRPIDRTFPLPDWRRRESDLLFHVPFRASEAAPEALVCVLVEHQSTADPAMPLRTLWYAVLYWEKLWREWSDGHERGQPLLLNPVLPIVLHTGHRPWSAPRTLRQLMGGPEAMHAYVPDWRPLFFDLAEHTAEDLLNRPGEWLPALAAVRAERDEPERFLEVLGEALRHLEPLRRQDENRWRELLHFLLSWGLRRRPIAERESLYTTVVASQKHADTRAEVEAMAERMFVMAEDELRAQGFAVGKEQGIAAGKKQGIAAGKKQGIAAGKKQGIAAGKKQGELSALRATLGELLAERFTDVPAELAARIDACKDPRLLRTAIRQVLRIQSIDELTL